MDEIHMISADLDGAELRREKRKGRYYSRCDGKQDADTINEGIQSIGRTQYSIPGHLWARIFGGKDGRR